MLSSVSECFLDSRFLRTADASNQNNYPKDAIKLPTAQANYRVEWMPADDVFSITPGHYNSIID